MERLLQYLTVSLFFGTLTVNIASGQMELQSGKVIPVYPGANLKTDLEPGDNRMCCNFVTKDNFDKVVGFYENALKIKPLDPTSLANQLPFLKPQTDEMLEQMINIAL